MSVLPSSGDGPQHARLLLHDAEQAAEQFAARLRQPEDFLLLLDRRRNGRPPLSDGATAGGLADGLAGPAMLFAELDRHDSGSGWDDAGHSYLAAAASTSHVLSQPGLFNGVAGLGLAGWCLSREGSRYGRMLAEVDRKLRHWALESIPRFVAGSCHAAEYDVVSGLSGVAAYLLCRAGNNDAREALLQVLDALVGLARGGSDHLPAWRLSPDALDTDLRAANPYGCVDCGLAHGIPGPLAIMALSAQAGVEVPGLHEALDRLGRWLIDWSCDDSFGPNWPALVPLEPRPTAAEAQEPPLQLSPRRVEASRSVWCYGSPGVARALVLAGDAVERAEYRECGTRAMEAVFRRPPDPATTTSCGLCHGSAGLLMSTIRCSQDLESPVLEREVSRLTDNFVVRAGNTLLGSENSDPHDAVEDPGLLMGAVGTALALLAAISPPKTGWDRALLLS